MRVNTQQDVLPATFSVPDPAVVAIAVNFVLGALMTAGIGLYAPRKALVFALGMSPQVEFPIMMGSCAFLMPPASAKFIREGAYNRMASLGMVGPSIAAVLIAAFIVKSMDLNVLRWALIAVILYTSAITAPGRKPQTVSSNW